jgi:hypothetical protein
VKVFIHPDWNPFVVNYDADIAVFQLEHEVHFSTAIQPICLWHSNNDPIACSGIVIGYGMSEDETKYHETIPKRLKVPILNSNEECFLREPEFARISSRRTFCAGGNNGSTPCLGDSGHGLFIKYQHVFYLRGIVSSGFLNEVSCDTSKFILYTNVLRFKDWIEHPSDDYDDRTVSAKQTTEQIMTTTTTTVTETTTQPTTTTTTNTITTPRGFLMHRSGVIESEYCGIMSHSTGLVVGGDISWRNQFPWLAIISVFDDGRWTNFGSGSLISHKYVVAYVGSVSYLNTTGLLIPVAINRVKVQLGATKYDDPSALTVGVSLITNHPRARKVTNSFITNIASLITLEKNVKFTEFIQPVCLWAFDDNLSAIVGKDAYAVGYGEEDDEDDSLTRKHVLLSISDEETCKSEYGSDFNFANETSLFCAEGNGNEGPCYNDFQLYMKIDLKWYLKGITNTIKVDEYGECDVEKPVLYEDIAPFVPWIKSLMEDQY